MSTQTILVIDDSSTIRKMVDSHLSQAGYRVVLAPNAETGLELAPQLKPDLILLDHQLPGTTGIEVCRKIIAMPECADTPFVISSTLRKQAYIEYMDVPNVVDSLPKPFNPELLKTTIANALEVGAMIVSSQVDGTAVPEVVGEVSDASLTGTFGWVGMREVLDFLCNCNKSGVLEIELKHDRVWFYLDNGRIQAVVSASVTAETVAAALPESLADMSAILKFTMSSGFASQMDGFVELLDRKVLDPRLLRALVRHQAAWLTWYCFQESPVAFSFFDSRPLPPLFRRSPLEISLAGLLVEAATNCQDHAQGIQLQEANGWVRRGLRGQNLDRAGLGAKHIQLLTHLGTEPVNVSELARKAAMGIEETYRCLVAFQKADWIESQPLTTGHYVVVLESDAQGAGQFRELFRSSENSWNGKVIRDEFGLQLTLNRKPADVLCIEVNGDSVLDVPELIRHRLTDIADDSSIVLIVPQEQQDAPIADSLSSYPQLIRPYQTRQILDVFEALEDKQPASTQDPAAVDKLVATGAHA